MKPALISKMFGRIRKDMGHLLEASHIYILDEAEGKMKATYKQFTKGNLESWGYVIHPERPLVFKQSERPTSENKVDIYCDMRWSEDSLPLQQDIKVRVWGMADELTYRKGLDAEVIQEKLTNPERRRNGRVISRYHFDKVNHQGSSISNEYHPMYHVQIGGKSEAYELCWHPSSFDIPRIPHQPMDFFLACQLIAINFFPTEYRSIRESAEWNTHLETTQRMLLREYYQSCIDAIDSGKSLLDELV